MKITFFLLLLFAAALPATAQPRQPRLVPNFTQIHVRNGISLRLRPDGPAAVEVEADLREQGQLLTTVGDGVLTIDWRAGTGQSVMRRSATVYVTALGLTGIRASNGAQVTSDAPLIAGTLSIETTAGSRLTLAVQASTLAIKASGGSTLTLSGQAEHLVLTATGGTSARTFALSSTRAEATASGGSTAELSVAQDLAATASGGSSIRYKGAARVSRSKSSSGGSVRQVE